MAERCENCLKFKAQFEEILQVVEEKLLQAGKGRRKQFLPIDQLFLTLTWIRDELIQKSFHRILIDALDTMYNHFHCVRKLHFPGTVGVCDNALLFVEKPGENDTQKQ